MSLAWLKNVHELTWTVRVPRSKVNYRALGVIAAVIFCLTVPFAAPIVLGPRGDLVGLLFQWTLEFGLSTMFALLCGLLFFKFKGGIQWALLRWASFAAFLLFASICLFSGWEAALSAVDLLLPFKERQVVVSKTYYEHQQTGRGAVPESGGWHIVTADHNDYTLRASGNGKRLHAGPYKIQLSHFKNLVMVAEPLR